MEVFKIDITSWTASFRYPNLISGYQPTLEVPPLIGYFFQYSAMEYDLETIYQITSTSKGLPSNNAKSNIINRQFLFENKLSIYLEDESLVEFLRQPFYDILLGRSNDLATIEKIEKVKLEEIKNADRVKGQIIPLENNMLAGKIQALPKYFSNTIPRLNLGTEPFSVIGFQSKDMKTKLTAYRDSAQLKDGVDIYFHEVTESIYE